MKRLSSGIVSLVLGALTFNDLLRDGSSSFDQVAVAALLITGGAMLIASYITGPGQG